MPNPTSGFSGNEIVSRVITYIGNSSPSFKTYMEQTLSLAQFRYCSMHDWNFLNKTGLSLAITNGTAEYELVPASIGFTMPAENVQSIFDEENGVYLQKVDLEQIRRFDQETDNVSENGPTHRAPVGDNRIRLYPPTFDTGTLKVDGVIIPSSIDNLADYPIIPYKYQEAFIEYVVSMALDRENDDRADGKKSTALALIKEDIKIDMANRGGDINPRFKAMTELSPVRAWNPLADD